MDNNYKNGFNMNNSYDDNSRDKYENLDNSLYTDGNDKKPKMILIIGGIILLLIIVLIAFFACGNKEKSSNNYLSNITVTGGTFEPKFDKDILEYNVLTDREIITISCSAESKKSKTTGCNERVVLGEACITHEIVVAAENKEEKRYSLNICNQLQGAPVIKDVKVSPSKFTKDKVVVTVEAESQEEIPLHEEAYSFDNGMTWQAKNTYTLTENAELNIKVRNSKNVESATLTKSISNIDKTKPKVEIFGSTPSGTSTSSNVMLDASVEPSTTLSEYKYQWYKNNNKISNATGSSYTATSSGTYKVVVTTGAGNSATSANYKVNKKTSGGGETSTPSYTVSITKISGNPTAWTSKDVTLTVSATASNGLNSKAYSFDGGTTWQASNSKTFSKNQTVKIVVRDSKGNKSSVSTQNINKIDKTSPSVSITGGSTPGSVLTANVTPTTVPSGIKYQWYKNNVAITGATNKTYTASLTASYSVKVTTGSGLTMVSGSKMVLNQITPTVTLKGSVGSGVQTTSSVTLTASVTNGTASKYTWYRGSTKLSNTSYSITTATSGTYKVVVKTTSNQEITSNSYVVKVVAPTPPAETDKTGPDVTVKLTTGSYNGKSYANGTWTNETVYATITATDSSGIADLAFQYLNGDDTWYSAYPGAWKDKKIDGNTGKAWIYFDLDRDDKFNVKVTDKKGNETIKKYTIKIDKTSPYTPIARMQDSMCVDKFREIKDNKTISFELIDDAKEVNYNTRESLLCLGSGRVSIDYKDDYSKIKSCEFTYPVDECGSLSLSWSKENNFEPNSSKSQCKLGNSKVISFGMRCYDEAGNVSKPMYVLSSMSD